jgi:hypothetical protein
MTVETTTPLDLDRDFFDSAETEILSTAFEKAWAFVEFDPKLGGLRSVKATIRIGALANGATEAWRNQSDIACEFGDQNATSTLEWRSEKTNTARLSPRDQPKRSATWH